MAHRYRLYPTDAQVEVLALHCEHARFVWNLALEQQRFCERYRPYRAGPRQLWPEALARQLTKARQAYSWLAAGSSSVQHQALRDFRQAMRNWWSGTHRHPTWRKAGVRDGFCVRDVRVERLNHRWARLVMPKIGWVRFRLTRRLPVGFGMARATLDRAGRWHVSFAAPQPPVVRESTGAVVGVDRGVTNPVATSDGDMSSPTSLGPKQAERRLRLERRLARQPRGSRRRQRTRDSLGRLRAREADRRRHWVEETTTRLVRAYDVVCVERLRPKDMTGSARGTIEAPGTNVAQKSGLNRGILAAAWGAFARRLHDKAAASGVVVLEVDPAHTSQTCAQCGHMAAENRQSQAVLCCRACGHIDHADINAAKIIRERGMQMLASAPGPGVAGRRDLQASARSTKRQPPALAATREAAA